jgi:hypothetical protein
MCCADPLNLSRVVTEKFSNNEGKASRCSSTATMVRLAYDADAIERVCYYPGVTYHQGSLLGNVIDALGGPTAVSYCGVDIGCDPTRPGHMVIYNIMTTDFDHTDGHDEHENAVFLEGLVNHIEALTVINE